MKKLLFSYAVLALCLFACAYPVAKKKVPEVKEVPVKRVVAEPKMIQVVYLPWQYQKLERIIALCETYPSLKMVVSFHAGYQDITDPENDAYRKLLALIEEKRIHIAMRLPHDPVLPLIAHTNDAGRLLKLGESLPVPPYSWPGDIRQQIANAREIFFKTWGVFPGGFIPFGGWLSPRAMKALGGMELAWCVSGPCKEGNGPLRIGTGYPDIFFMDHELISTIYRADSALRNTDVVSGMMHRIEQIEEDVVTVVFDEDHYTAQYHRHIIDLLDSFAGSLQGKTTGYRFILPEEVLGDDDRRLKTINLKEIPVSSWQDNTLSSWIGGNDKNAAWGLLAQVRDEVQRYQNSGSADIKRLSSALDEVYDVGSAEYFSSFGEADDAGTAYRKKEEMFKASLINIYRMVNKEPPEDLYHPLKDLAGFSSGLPDMQGTTMEIGSGYVRWFDMTGDDDGPGDILYPLPQERYPAGSYDLQFFLVRYDNDTVYFDLCFGTMTSVFNSPLGFDLPMVDIYMDLNNRSGAGATKALPGREFFIEPLDAWEYCININGWGARLYRSVSRNEIRKIDAHVRIHASMPEKKVTVSVPRMDVRGNPLNWGYVVVVMGNDRESTATPPAPLAVVNNPKREHVFRVIRAGYALPPIIDVLVPHGKDQKKLLGVYRKRIPITLPAVRVKG